MKRSHVVFLASLFLAAACNDSTGPNYNGSPGTVSFAYTGGGDGSYSTTGTLSSTSQAGMHASAWASGFSVDEDNSTLVYANKPTGGGLASKVFLMINRQTVGSDEISDTCNPAVSTCSLIGFSIGSDADGENFTYSCVMTSGTIAISAISSSTVTGTFSGVGICVNGITFQQSPATVTSGSFSAPVRANLPGIF